MVFMALNVDAISFDIFLSGLFSSGIFSSGIWIICKIKICLPNLNHNKETDNCKYNHHHHIQKCGNWKMSQIVTNLTKKGHMIPSQRNNNCGGKRCQYLNI